MIPDPSPPFDFEIAKIARDDIIGILKRAGQLGIQDEIGGMLLGMENELRMRPRDWGDPIRLLRRLNVLQYRRMIRPLIVNYAVHERKPYVVLNRVEVIPGDPLSDSSDS